MFTDIVDSTRLVELLGDEQWESLLAWHDRTLRRRFEARAGEEVKHEGAYDRPDRGSGRRRRNHPVTVATIDWSDG
jgi:hypothetical protein